MNDRLKKQMEFIMEMDKEKGIGRQTYILKGDRKENDAEHSWHLALMAMLLSEYSNEEVDVAKVMSMVLVHDLIEIDAGDTFAYDDKGNETKRERELAAAERIFNLLPEDQAAKLRGLWDEFEEAKTPEAKFALAMDSVQPLMLNDASGGKSWREHDVEAGRVLERIEKKIAPGSNVLAEMTRNVVEENIEKGNLR